MTLSNSQEILDRYYGLFDSLAFIIRESNKRVIEELDPLIGDNQNFFVKSYLVNICSYLEAYLQDIAFMYVQDIDSRFEGLVIPYNLLQWNVLGQKLQKKDLKYGIFAISITKEDIADQLSANPHKTIKLFEKLGIDLRTKPQFESTKDVITSVVNKRNSIIHHNDSAGDISFTDLLCYIDSVKTHMNSVQEAIENACVVSN